MNKKGFSIIEIILVLLLMMIVFSFTALYYQASRTRSDLNSQVNLLVNEIRLIRSNVVSGLITQPNAIRLEENAYIKFLGEEFDSEDENNIAVELPPTIKISDINLNEESQEIIFQSPDGRTENFGSFTLKSENINRFKTININEIGTINY